jgi:serine O-acetyltransferase
MSDYTIPDKKDVEKTIKSIFRLLFPSTNSYSDIGNDNSQSHARILLLGLLIGLTGEDEKVADTFFENLEDIKKTLLLDGEYILESDPAATELIEVLAIYPGFLAIFCYRIANALAKLSVPLLPRMITEYSHKVTGIDIHPHAEIGCPFAIDHGTGIVIGETTKIGNYVKLYQGVTLGALSVDKSKASKKRHPTIEDNVVLYSGCTILGGDTVVGRNSVIGGNVWLTESIAPFSVVYHKSEIIVRNQNGFQEPINFII